MRSQMMRVISSPSSSTTGLATLILSIIVLLGMERGRGPRKGGVDEAIAGAKDGSQRRQDATLRSGPRRDPLHPPDGGKYRRRRPRHGQFRPHGTAPDRA